MPRHLTLFDLDGTLLPTDSDHAFGEFLVHIGWADGEAHRRATIASTRTTSPAGSTWPPTSTSPRRPGAGAATTNWLR
jgi:FMN phosphatase YigB (HAD superfamily)